MIYLFVLFILFAFVRNIPYVKSPIAKKEVGKYDDFSLVLDMNDVFGSTDGSRIMVSVKPNKWITSIFAEPQLTSSYEYIKPQVVAVSGNYLYSGSEYEYNFVIVDVSDPTSPVITAKLEEKLLTFTKPYVDTEESYLYILCEDDDVKIYDISDKSNPVLTGTISIESPGGVYVVDNLAYISYKRGIAIYDVSSKVLPIQLGITDNGFLVGKAITVIGEFALLQTYSNLWVYNISNSSSVTVAKQFGVSNFHNFVIQQDFAYLGCGSSRGLVILNITDPANPIEMSNLGYHAVGLPKSISIKDKLVYILESPSRGGFIIINVTNSTHPELISMDIQDVESSFHCSQGNYAYFSSEVHGFQIYELTSNITHPQQITQNFMAGPRDPVSNIVKGKYMYSLGADLGEAGGEYMFRIFSIDRIMSPPVLLGYMDASPGNSESPVDMDIDFEKKVAYVATASELSLVNISDPYNPVLISRIRPLRDYPATALTGVSFFGDYVAISLSQFSFSIINVSHPQQPSRVEENGFSSGHPCAAMSSVIFEDQFVYLSFTCSPSSIRIYDVSNIQSPLPVGITQEVIKPLKMFLKYESKLLYVADDHAGLKIFNVTDITSPVLLKEVNTYKALNVMTVESQIFVADDAAGLKIIGPDGIVISSSSLDPDKNSDTSTRDVFVDSNGHGEYMFVAERGKGIFIYRNSLQLLGSSEEFSGFCGSTEIVLEAKKVEEEEEEEGNSIFHSFIVERKDDRCHGHGKCLKNYECFCEEDYLGDACESWECFSIDFKSTQDVCSGHGNCISPNRCKCHSQYAGELCKTNTLYLTVMTPILSVTGMGIFLLFICGICGICFFCFVCFIALLIVLCCCCGLVVRQMRGLKKYSRLQNFELLLKEQELDEDTTIAHLRINKDLFEIPFDEIKTISILGEGGSSSVVFKAYWKNTVVAFKCFKTRNLLNSQDSFDEFEREVEILGSLSHPNIIRFFGATMQKPRVGIVMEFACNGEILDYVKKFRKKSGSAYPLFQKLRMLYQIASAMLFIHSRSIIHRDLKSENVLIDEKENTKLMDFGLSRLVDNMSIAKTLRVGTSVYMAPEIVTDENYTEKCDVFSFAILFHILLTEDPNPYGSGAFQVEIKVANDATYRPDLKEISSFLKESDEGRDHYKWITKMITKSWDHDPEKRYSFKDLCVIIEKGYTKITKDESKKGIFTTTIPILDDNKSEEENNSSDELEEEEDEEEEQFRSMSRVDFMKLVVKLKKENMDLQKEKLEYRSSKN